MLCLHETWRIHTTNMNNEHKQKLFLSGNQIEEELIGCAVRICNGIRWVNKIGEIIDKEDNLFRIKLTNNVLCSFIRGEFCTLYELVDRTVKITGGRQGWIGKAGKIDGYHCYYGTYYFYILVGYEIGSFKTEHFMLEDD